ANVRCHPTGPIPTGYCERQVWGSRPPSTVARRGELPFRRSRAACRTSPSFGNVARTQTRRSTPGGTDRLTISGARADTDRSGTKGGDRSGAGWGVPVIYTTPVSRADGTDGRHPATIAAFAD